MHFTAKMIPLFMMFAGGPLGSGKQWYFLHFYVSLEYFYITQLDVMINMSI